MAQVIHIYDSIGTLDIHEVHKMLKQNNIEIPKNALIQLFSIVNPKRPNELQLEEFI